MNRLLRYLKNAPANPPIFPSGHFYSPYPDLGEIKRRGGYVFDRSRRELPGIDLNEAEQLNLLEAIAAHGADLERFQSASDRRFAFDNPAYGQMDADVLFCMLLELRPGRVIEVGSGHSSSLMLDVRERFFGGDLELTFIEPRPQLLTLLFRPGDSSNTTLIDSQLQDVDIELFDGLEPGDLLFIDSSHISKAGSDVNRVIFEILPRLASGVNVHVHDVHYPFEYPREWIEETRAWNEAYMMRAFLQENETFEITFFNHFLHLHHREKLGKTLSACGDETGSSIWLRKTAPSRPAI